MTDGFGDLTSMGLGEPGRPWVIAEAGSNHDGDLGVAVELVHVAGQAGCDAVKFQLFRADHLYPRNVGMIDTPMGRVDFHALLSSIEFDPTWIPALQDAARAAGVALVFTPFDEEAVALCVQAGSAVLKMASPELTDHPLFEVAAQTDLPLLVSTGMASLGDIEETLAVVAGRVPVALLQCTTAYPCPEQDANLAVIATLRTAFELPVGLSDHTLDPEAAPAVATSLGAAVIEKHITLGRDRAGPDHPFAIEPGELEGLVRVVHEVAASDDPVALVRERFGANRVLGLAGSGQKVAAPSESVLARVDRRSIHAQRDLAAGDIIGRADVAVLRGEVNLRPGLHPRHLATVLGARLARPVGAGQGVVWDDLLHRGEP